MELNKKEKVLVVGASPNASRYSYAATRLLAEKGHEVILFGSRKGNIDVHQIIHEFPEPNEVDTVTMYMNPERQKPFYNQIIGLNPQRIIFNPGTENSELVQMANESGIKTENACTLVMLQVGTF
ncbi:MAG: CoA-binding protein [Crocinitomicaceae bacterium]|nr:CoA-binding protein [Crocinitomicaceae bacterium]|tara:strand:- start:19453 stop:19827 length:375 start_codon:yes stop_codon:yes gene_type:complete